MKKSSTMSIIVFTSILAIPVVTFAAGTTSGGVSSFATFVDLITNTVVKSLATLFMSLALLAFFYGIVEYILARRDGNPDALKKGNLFMTWGLVALFVMFSVYGIIKFGQGILFGSGVDVTTIKIPDIRY